MPTRPQQHKPYAPRKQGNRQATRALHTGSKAWRYQRQRVLVRDLYRCQAPGCGRIGNQVDHIDGNASLDVPDEALQTLCHDCHSAKTMRELNASMGHQVRTGAKGCDVNGIPYTGHWAPPQTDTSR